MAEIFTDGIAAGPCVPVGQRRCLPRTNTFHHSENCSPATTKTTTTHSVSARSRGVGLWASQAVADFSRRETYGFLRFWDRRGVEHTTTALCPRGRSQMSGRKLRWPGLGLGGGRRQHPGLRVRRDGPALLMRGDLRGVGSAVVAGKRDGAIQVPENVCPQRWDGCCRSVRLPLTLGEGDGT